MTCFAMFYDFRDDTPIAGLQLDPRLALSSALWVTTDMKVQEVIGHSLLAHFRVPEGFVLRSTAYLENDGSSKTRLVEPNVYEKTTRLRLTFVHIDDFSHAETSIERSIRVVQTNDLR